jgi:hypothetical protein
MCSMMRPQDTTGTRTQETNDSREGENDMDSNEVCTDCGAGGILISPAGQCHQCEQDQRELDAEDGERNDMNSRYRLVAADDMSVSEEITSVFDARLIAQAPAMREALNGFLEWYKGLESPGLAPHSLELTARLREARAVLRACEET